MHHVVLKQIVELYMHRFLLVIHFCLVLSTEMNHAITTCQLRLLLVNWLVTHLVMAGTWCGKQGAC